MVILRLSHVLPANLPQVLFVSRCPKGSLNFGVFQQLPCFDSVTELMDLLLLLHLIKHFLMLVTLFNAAHSSNLSFPTCFSLIFHSGLVLTHGYYLSTLSDVLELAFSLFGLSYHQNTINDVPFLPVLLIHVWTLYINLTILFGIFIFTC